MHKKFIVKGIVQGVSYRLSTQEKAIMLGLQGWVCNKTNGDVLLQASGSADAIDELESWLWQGPTHARVDSIETETLADTTELEYHGFIIKPDQT